MVHCIRDSYAVTDCAGGSLETIGDQLSSVNFHGFIASRQRCCLLRGEPDQLNVAAAPTFNA